MTAPSSAAIGEVIKVGISVVALITSIGSVFLTLYRDTILQPALKYSVVELDRFPGNVRAEIEFEPGKVIPLRWGIKVPIRSTGWTTATEIELRVSTNGNTFIVQIHTDNQALVEKLPDIGRQGSREVTVSIRRMVPREKVVLTFWYGRPGPVDGPAPPKPSVLLRHAAALGILESAGWWR